MKYCPKCGNQLPDEANFCPKCGAPQPSVQQPSVQQAPTPHEIVTQPNVNSQPLNQGNSPRERYNNLYKNDEVFKEIVLYRRKKYLFELINIVFIITLLVSLLTPVALFTGINATSEGAQMMSVVGMSLPYEACAYDLIELDLLSGNKALAPGSLNNAYAIVTVIFGVIFSILLVVFPIIKAFTGRGYILRQYEAGKAKQLIKESMQPFVFGSLLNLMTLVSPLNFYIIASNAEYKDGKTYLFGEITGIQSGFITVIVVAAIITIVSLVLNILISNLLGKKLKGYYKNL